MNKNLIKMKLRKAGKKELEEKLESPDCAGIEREVVTELLAKFNEIEGVETTETVAKAPAKKVPVAKKKAEEELPIKEEKDEEVYHSEETLTPEEEALLKKAEEEFDEKMKNRKTPSKSVKGNAKKETVAKAPAKKETKTERQNLEESMEVPGFKIGTKVYLKGGDKKNVGEITRIYVSDGKEKCMVKFSDGKVKKRITAIEKA